MQDIKIGDTVIEEVSVFGNNKWIERQVDSDVFGQVKMNPEKFRLSSKGRRTGIEFGHFDLILNFDKLTRVYHLKHPEYSNMCSVKLVVTEGLTVVTGDYGNWLFGRTFHPQSGQGVSDGYWKEKLRQSSTQEPDEFDPEATKTEILAWLHDNIEDPLTKEETEYLEACLTEADCGKMDYEYTAFHQNVGRFQDHEYVPHVMKTQYWLEVVFDAFEEICKRSK